MSNVSASHPIVAPKKLIEVALPLDEINKASAREKSIRHGHPSTLHLWWARRPLAAARAVLFAQMVNDPSWKYSEEELKKPQIKSAITRKRNELFKLITQLVQWENINNDDVLNRARAAIRESWRETCEANKNHPDAKTLFNADNLPPFHDPFAGGGSIPLEAQRLGLEAHATDLNPVAVLINKAMIEIPPNFAGRAPVGPLPPGEKQTKAKATEDWSGAKGLAEDVRRYGAWVRDEAWKRIGHLYPNIKITKKITKQRPDLEKYEGQSLTIIAWIWARTIKSPNPAFSDVDVPLVSSFVLSAKPGKQVWIEPKIVGRNYELSIRLGSPPSEASQGTKAGRGSFRCIMSNATITGEYIKEQGQSGRMGHRLLAIVAEGNRERVFLSSLDEHIALAASVAGNKIWKPNLEFAKNSRHMTPWIYGLSKFADLFTDRQLYTINTFADLISEARNAAEKDIKHACPENDRQWCVSYGDAIATYICFALDRVIDRLSTVSTWDASPSKLQMRNTFARQALQMTWDYAEGNPFANSSGTWTSSIDWVAESLDFLPFSGILGHAYQHDARTAISQSKPAVVSSDPPYYDNVPYADLADYFYVWLRRSLRKIYPELFATLGVPKSDELVADQFRHQNKQAAEQFFMDGMVQVMRSMAQNGHPAFPVSIYYAFKQADTKEEGTASVGWESFLEAVIASGLGISGTWPVRTELENRMRGAESNALASSIVLVCRCRAANSMTVSRREFSRELSTSMPNILAEMTEDSTAAIAPVDLAQAALGPGMAIFSRYKAVLEADGSPMSVHSALIHINKAIDDYFAQAEGDMDADTRFCIGWFQQYEYEVGPFGQADVLARAKGTSVEGVRDAGVIHAAKGEVRLLRVKEYPASWDPTKDSRLPIWEACHQMCRALGESESEAGALLARMPDKQDAIRQLAYRLYTICERKGWAEDARAYNELVTSWPAIVEQSLKAGHKGSQMSLL